MMDNRLRQFMSAILPDIVKKKAWRSHYYAHYLATSSKRIDICAAEFANILHLSQLSSLQGKVCLELGSGWVLSHALVMYLLGAKKVIATDIFPLARPEVLSSSLRNAISYIPRDILAPFSDHSSIRERYDRLLSVPKFSLEQLKELGIEYLAPVDFASQEMNLSVDFIYSNSVLEHVPKEDINMLLHNLKEILNQNGVMIHSIHLEDHKDFKMKPFDFLSIGEIQYTRKLQSERGNRIRFSEWKRIFSGLEGVNTNYIYSYSRLDRAIPDSIDPSIEYDDEHDLRTSHIGVYTYKQ
jgi:cyclopropane fatty-acyl-phospholipid synthase-like methyltransferase